MGRNMDPKLKASEELWTKKVGKFSRKEREGRANALGARVSHKPGDAILFSKAEAKERKLADDPTWKRYGAADDETKGLLDENTELKDKVQELEEKNTRLADELKQLKEAGASG